MLVYCKKCVTPDSRPKIHFDKDGICSACVSAQEKREEIDWIGRENELREIFDRYRSADRMEYDCIVPVSGGKDSIYQVHVVKNVYQMNPLCLTFRTLARTPRGEENLQALRNMGVDHIDFSPNPVGINKLTRKAFETVGDSSLVDHLAIWTITANMAVKLGIPLVVWGENPDMEYGGPEEDRRRGQLDTEFMRNQDILKNRTAFDWADENLPLYELSSLVYPAREKLEQLGFQPIFLGYYLPWDIKQNISIARQYGFKPREKGPIMGLYDYSDLDCMNIVIHHYFKWLKFGFNRVTDNASNEIRKGRMDREEAIKLVREKDGIKPPKEYIEAFCRQIGITWDDFWATAEGFRNSDIWKKDENGEWYIEGWIGGDRMPDRFPFESL